MTTRSGLTLFEVKTLALIESHPNNVIAHRLIVDGPTDGEVIQDVAQALKNAGEQPISIQARHYEELERQLDTWARGVWLIMRGERGEDE